MKKKSDILQVCNPDYPVQHNSSMGYDIGIGLTVARIQALACVELIPLSLHHQQWPPRGHTFGSA